MKITLAILCLFACSNSALAQYGVSNARDGYGNLIRNSGMNSGRSGDRAPVNNGAIRNNPNQAPSSNPNVIRGTTK